MTTTTEMMRANRVTVQPSGGDTGGFKADFYKTHKHLVTVFSNDVPTTEWYDGDISAKGTTKTQLREAFRQYVMNNSKLWGVEYDPIDRRQAMNKRKSVYASDTDVVEDVINMISDDITTFINKMPHSDMIGNIKIDVEDIAPMTTTTSGRDLSAIGIYDGRYLNGNWAWADIELTVTMVVTVDEDTKKEIYQPVNMQLVSGQLKKMKMNQTIWNAEVMKSFNEAGIVFAEPVKEDKSKDNKDSKEEPKAEPKKRGRKSKKDNNEEIQEG